MKVLVAIPAYNCAAQLPRVLDEIGDDLAGRLDEIDVIDNGSSDGTLEMAFRYQDSGRLGQLRVFRNPHNVSLGGTHKIAFQRAAAGGFTHVVILHGDDQALSSEIASFLDRAGASPVQTLLGSRFNRRSRLVGYDWKRIAGNRVLNVIYTVFTGRHCEDLGSGLNLFAVADLDERTYLRFADRLTFNFELLLDLIRRRVRFAFQPITWREEDQVSNARNVQVAWTAVRNLLAWRFGKGPDDTRPLPELKAYYRTEEVGR